MAQQAQNPHEGHGHAPKPDTEALRKSITRELQTMEVLKAEALIMQDTPDLEGAADIIDEVRDRAKLGALPTSVRSNKNVLLNALLKERRLELAFEGQRWFDLVRLDKVEEVMNAVYSKDSGRKAQIYTFDKNSYRLPIPQSVIDANDKIHQNPGY